MALASVARMSDYRPMGASPRRAPPRADTGLRAYGDNRLSELRRDRESWRSHWRMIADYQLPRRFKWLITADNSTRGQMMNQRIIDSTATLALRTMTSGMMAGITSRARPWFRLRVQDPDLGRFMPVKLWLEDCTNRVHWILAHSNFYQAMAKFYLQIGVFGTGVLIIYEDFQDAIRCYVPIAGEYFLAQNSRLDVDTLGREFTRTGRQLVQEFGQDNVSATVKGMMQGGGRGWPEREVVVGGLVEPNDRRLMDTPGAKGMPWRQIYWEVGAGQDMVLQLRGFHERPFVAARWDTGDNDAYGSDNPGMICLGDALQLQIEQKRRAEGIEKQVRPPLVGDIQLQNQPLANVPGGVTYVAKADGVGLKSIYDVELNLHDLVEDVREVQARIKETYFYDLFLMISQLDTVRTATEIIARKEEKLMMLGPLLENLEGEALTPAIERVFGIALRAGLLPPAPREMAGQPLSIRYTSMLSEAQGAVRATPIERIWGFAGNIAAGGKPEVLDNLDEDASINEYGEALGVTPRILRDSKVVMAMRQARARQMEQQKQAELTQAMVAGARTLSQVDVGGGQNAVSAMLGNSGGAA